MALTDHNTFNTSKDAKEKLSFLGENFEILHGEEIHNSTDDCYAGYFHLVHIGGKYSINEIYQNNPERIEKEILERQKDLITAKTESIKSQKRVEELYSEALKAMRTYAGAGGQEDYDDEDY